MGRTGEVGVVSVLQNKERAGHTEAGSLLFGVWVVKGFKTSAKR